jgi:hypothetical protein
VHAVTPDSVATQLIAGQTVTSVARTVVDLAASVGFEQAVIVADAALHRKLTSKPELADELLVGRGRHGMQRAVKVIEFSDARSESAGESRSRVGMCRARLVAPDLQFGFFHPDGSEFARTDFAWAVARLLGEFDGLAKYGRLLQRGQTPEDAFIAERRRQDALHDLGYEMVRWTWAELSRPDLLYPRIRKAFDRSSRLHGAG